MVQNLGLSLSNQNNSRSSPCSFSIDTPQSDDISDISNCSFSEVPLTALGKNSRRQLSNLLNSRKILRSEEGYERDWRGIAALAQQKNLCDESSLSGDDPMAKVLQLWCKNNPELATFANLEIFLGIIDRWDVCDDIYENLIEDAKAFNLLQQKKLSKSSLNEYDSNQANDCDVDFGLGSDSNILTKDDVLRAQQGLSTQKYDAFVLFADADINYAVELQTKLEENPKYKFKLCIKDRDLLAGVTFAHVALTQIIEERCKHLIVILTEEFFKSPENKFLVNYTEAVQIQSRTRKIIPLIYDDTVALPRTLKIYTCLRYSSSSGLFDFWSKLASSIRNFSIAETSSSPVSSNPINSSSTPKEITNLYSSASQTNNQTLSPNFIPSIKINGCSLEEDDVHAAKTQQQQKQHKFLKNSALRTNPESKLSVLNGLTLRNAHSTSQLNAGLHYKNDLSASTSDLSTTSSPETKKKKKWTNKIKKVFSRSSTKLHEPA